MYMLHARHQQPVRDVHRKIEWASCFFILEANGRWWPPHTATQVKHRQDWNINCIYIFGRLLQGRAGGAVRDTGASCMGAWLPAAPAKNLASRGVTNLDICCNIDEHVRHNAHRSSRESGTHNSATVGCGAPSVPRQQVSGRPATIFAAVEQSGPTSNAMTQSEPPQEGSEARQVPPQCAAMAAKYDAIVAAFAHGGVKKEAVLEFR